MAETLAAPTEAGEAVDRDELAFIRNIKRIEAKHLARSAHFGAVREFRFSNLHAHVRCIRQLVKRAGDAAAFAFGFSHRDGGIEGDGKGVSGELNRRGKAREAPILRWKDMN